MLLGTRRGMSKANRYVWEETLSSIEWLEISKTDITDSKYFFYLVRLDCTNQASAPSLQAHPSGHFLPRRSHTGTLIVVFFARASGSDKERADYFFF